MFDAFKGLAGGVKTQKQQSDDLLSLIAAAREERGALSSMLTQISMRTSKLQQMGKSLEHVDQKAVAASTRLEGLLAQVEALEERTRTLNQIDARVQALLDAAAQAQHAVEALMSPEGDLQKHRQYVQQLGTQALAAQASVEALKREHAALEELRSQLRSHRTDVTQSADAAAAVRAELDQTRGVAAQLAQEYSRLRDGARETREDSRAAAEAVKEVETKLGALLQLQELSRTTEERLVALNALAEHVATKTKALDTQKVAVERAVLEANRLNEMVWNMDVQIGRLQDGMKQASRAEEAVTRVEKLVEEATTRADAIARMRDELARESGRFEKDGRALVDGMRVHVERLALQKKELDAFDERRKALELSIAEAEGRMTALGTKEKSLSVLHQRADELAQAFQGLLASAEELTKKQAGLDALHEQLSRVDELSRRTNLQYEGLRDSRRDLEGLRAQIAQVHAAHADAAQLQERLAADRAALEAFGDRMGSFMARTPQLEASIDAINAKLSLVDAGTASATRLGEVAGELEAQLTRLSSRAQFVEKLENRIDSLQSLATQVDATLMEQLGRRAELDALKSQCDSVVAQALDAQQKIERVAALQNKVLPLAADLDALRSGLEQAEAQFRAVRRDEASILEQQARLVQLVEQGRGLATQAEERLKQLQALSSELARAATAKEELVGELARVEARQRDAVAQSGIAEDQIARAEAMFKQLEQRRTQLTFADKKVAAVEGKLAELARKQDDVEQQMKAIADRESVVAAVKADVESVREISARSRADLQYVAEHREDVAGVRRLVHDLLAKAGETEERIAAIESRRKVVEEVQGKATLIGNLLEDVRISLETLGEQKALVDHVVEKLARLEFEMQEAQNTMRSLQHERELAERIEQSIRQLRARSGSPQSAPKQAVNA